ncbi:MAG: hypothetical protein ACYC61_20875 [Isosphaeraceae bacterium]
MRHQPPGDLRPILLDGRSIQRAQKHAWRDAMIRHKRLGQPIVVWREGKVVWIPAEEIEVPREDVGS